MEFSTHGLVKKKKTFFAHLHISDHLEDKKQNKKVRKYDQFWLHPRQWGKFHTFLFLFNPSLSEWEITKM